MLRDHRVCVTNRWAVGFRRNGPLCRSPGSGPGVPIGIIEAFPDDEAPQTHLAGPVGQELDEKAELFASTPKIVKLDVLVDKL